MPNKLSLIKQAVSMSKKDFVDEHTKLIEVLKDKKPKELNSELEEQSEELKEVVSEGSEKKASLSLIKTAVDHCLRNRLFVAASKGKTAPTEKEKASGVYQKGHVTIHGLRITIENPKGSCRTGTDKNGKPWSNKMKNHYGYIKGTEGKDGDHVDVFIGNCPESQSVFVIDQNRADGSFDEHKCILGVHNETDAKATYLQNYQPGWKGLGAISHLTVSQFKDWLAKGDQTKPLKGKRLSIFTKKAVKLDLDTLTYPLTGDSNTGATLAGAAVGAVGGAGLNIYRKIRRKVLGLREDEDSPGLLSSAAMGAALGGAGSAMWRGMSSVLGGPNPYVKPTTIQPAEPIGPLETSNDIHNPEVQATYKQDRSLINKEGGFGSSPIIGQINSDSSLSSYDRYRLLGMAQSAIQASIPLNPHALINAGFAELAAWISNHSNGERVQHQGWFV